MKQQQGEIIPLSAISTPPPPPLLAGSAACDGSRHATAHRAHGVPGAPSGRHAPSSWYTPAMQLRMLHHIQKWPCPPQPGERALAFPGTPRAGSIIVFICLSQCYRTDWISSPKGAPRIGAPQNMAADVGLGGQVSLRVLRAPAERLAEGDEVL